MNNLNILIFGSGSILTNELVTKFKHLHNCTVAFSGKICKIENVNSISVNNALQNNFTNYDVIIIVSAYIAFGSNETSSLYLVNVSLVKSIIEKYKSSKIIFCSTISLFEPSINSILTENSLLNPQNEYAISKLWAEKIITCNTNNYAIFRISSLVGKQMKENTFIPLIINNAISKNEITLLGNGSRLQNYIHVTDLVNMINTVIKKNMTGLFLAVNSESYSNVQIAEKIQYYLPTTKIKYTGTDNSLNYIFDATETFHKLNYTPRFKIDNIINELIKWKTKQF
jgi:nucleoside-diphosphate-sugar epimerase